MSDTSDTGVIDSCRTCKKIKWAGTHPDCNSCRAKRQMTAVPHGVRVEDEKPKKGE